MFIHVTFCYTLSHAKCNVHSEILFVTLQGKYDPFETAIYAVLSGNLKSVLPVCHSWYDCLWAYFRTLVDVKVEQEIRLRSITFRKPADLPPQYWDRLYVFE